MVVFLDDKIVFAKELMLMWGLRIFSRKKARRYLSCWLLIFLGLDYIELSLLSFNFILVIYT